MAAVPDPAASDRPPVGPPADDPASAAGGAPAPPGTAPSADRPTHVRLPRGRHGLSREEVERSQRERIMTGMATAMTEHGYVKTSVTEILRRAAVSRQTFYEQFSSKEDCFAATYAWSAEVVMQQLAGAGEAPPEGDQSAPIDRMLGFYLRSLARYPDFARVLLIETYAAGPAALQRRIAMQGRFAELVAHVLGARTAEDRFACEVLVGGISSLVTARLAVEDTEGLLALEGPLAAMGRRVASTFAAPA